MQLSRKPIVEHATELYLFLHPEGHLHTVIYGHREGKLLHPFQIYVQEYTLLQSPIFPDVHKHLVLV